MPSPQAQQVVNGLRRAGWTDEPIVDVACTRLTPHVTRAQLEYRRPCRRMDGRNPDTVIVKWPRPEACDAELSAYQRLADVVAAPTPRWALLRDHHGAVVALLLEDVDRCGVPFDDRMLKLAVDRLARFHAAFWAAVPEGVDSAHVPEIAPGWARAVALDTTTDEWCEEIEATLLEARPLHGPPRTLVHGALTPDHVLATRDDVRFVHWNEAHGGHGVVDLAVLLGSAVSPVHGPREWDLVLRYHASLTRAGVTGYGPDEAWSHYQWAKADALRGAVAAWQESPSRPRKQAATRLARAFLPKASERAA